MELTVHVLVTSSLALLPSRDRIANVCCPTSSGNIVYGLEHVWKSSPFKRHSKLSASAALNVNVAKACFVIASGAADTVGAEGVEDVDPDDGTVDTEAGSPPPPPQAAHTIASIDM